MDIVVTLPISAGGMNHLQEKIDACPGAYWYLSDQPRYMGPNDKVFICCEGWVRGYFTVREAVWEENASGWDSQFYISFEEWVSINPILTRGFPGFRYRGFDYQENREPTVKEWLAG